MDMLLISPDHGNKEKSFPWGILALGSYLTNVKKYDVKILDANTLAPSEFHEELDILLPSTGLIGIGCFTTDVYSVKAIVDHIKNKYPEKKVILGGPHVVLEPEQTCQHGNIDFTAYTDGELTVSALIHELGKDEPDFTNVPGLIYKSNGIVQRTDPPSFVGFYDINYDLLPECSRKLFPKYIQVLTGRGCSYRCRFCYNSVICQKFIPKPMEDVVDEIAKLVDEYDPEVVYFRDDNFFQVKQRIIDFIRLYKEKGFKFRWRATCRANYFSDHYINSELLHQLEEVNCEILKIGVESGSQRVLNYLRKNITIDNIKRAVCEISKSKLIKGSYSFMVALPTQTVNEYIETIEMIKFILDHEPTADIIGPQYFRVYPGGSLYDEIVEKYGHEKPDSFQQWAERTDTENDPLGFYRDAHYSWIPKQGRDLALSASLLVLLYRKPYRDFCTMTKFSALPFVSLAKLRVKHNYYRHLYDIKFLMKLYGIYRSLSSSAKSLGA